MNNEELPLRAEQPLRPPKHENDWTNASWRGGVRRRLIAWFNSNARSLPWRDDPTPYRVWVSEVMLQQTQVATVLPYYRRFLKSFPTVVDLAAADEQELMRHWEGLGYYRRARSMHAAAKTIVETHEGEFPEQFDDVLALPGIGRYTAGAILSIACGAKQPILEGNTQRVFSRWVALQSPPADREATKLLWSIAQRMLPPRGAGTFNQAAMELGALVCTPRDPDCPNCPVRSLCRAYSLGLEQEIPGKVSRVQYEDRTEFAMVIPSPTQEAFLMRPIPEGMRWAGLWDFPRATDEKTSSKAAAGRWLQKQLDLKVTVGTRMTTLRHAVTKYRIQLHVHECVVQSVPSGPPAPWRFITLAEMSRLPLSVTGRKIATLLDGQ